MRAVSKHFVYLMYLWIGGMGVSIPANAKDEPLAIAELDRSEASVGESVLLTLTLNRSPDKSFELPVVDGLELREAGTSNNISIVNGSMTREIVYSFEVTPLKAGQFVIPSFRLKLDKVDVSTLPLTLRVLGGGGNGGSAGSSQGTPPPTSESSPNNQEAQSSNQDVDPASSPVFIVRELAKSSLYEGESVLSKVKIYYRVRMQLTPERASAPAWRIITKDGQEHTTETVQGVSYKVMEITEVLIPLKSGRLDVPQFSARITYVEPQKRRQGRVGSMWDLLQNGMMDFGKEVTKSFSSKSMQLDVAALPAEGRPKVVSDMVGQFRATADVSTRELLAKDTTTVTVEVEGQGALDRMIDVVLKPIPGVRVYPDKPQLKEEIKESGLHSKKVFKFALVPSSGGDIKLEPVALGYFDPGRQVWDTLTLDLGSIVVKPQVSEQTAPPREGPQQTPIQDQTNHNQVSNQNSASNQAPPVPDFVAEIPEPRIFRLSITNWFAIVLAAFGGSLCIWFGVNTWKRRRPTQTLKHVLAGIDGMIQGLEGQSQKSQDLLRSNYDKIFLEMRQRLALDGERADALTSQDVVKRLRDLGYPSHLLDPLGEQLALLESCRYLEPIQSQPVDYSRLGDTIVKLAQAEVPSTASIDSLKPSQKESQQ
jgi:hypothetical protein